MMARCNIGYIAQCVKINLYKQRYSMSVRRTILRALWWLLRILPDESTCDVPKHTGHWSDEHILCM